MPTSYDYTADELRADLERLGVEDPQAALARALGVHRITVGHWLDGTRRAPSALPWAIKALVAKLAPAPREADALKRWMERHAYTADSLADVLGIDASTVRRWISGERPVSLRYALALAAAASDEVERKRRKATVKAEEAQEKKRSRLEPPKDADLVIEPIRFSRAERLAVGEAASAAGMPPRTFIKRRALEGLPV